MEKKSYMKTTSSTSAQKQVGVTDFGLNSLRTALSSVWPKAGIDLEMLAEKDLAILKGKLEGPVSNLSRGVMRDGISVAASLFLARKVLPGKGTKEEAEGGLFQKLTQPGPEAADGDWGRSAFDACTKLFPKGWDKNYSRYTEFFRVNATAGLKRGKSARREIEEEWSLNEWTRVCAEGDLHPISEGRKIVAIPDGGKWRTVTVSDAWQAQLAPLHHLLYDILCSHRWMLRGEPDVVRIKSMLRGEETGMGKEADVFVSGDYEAATDNFVPLNSARLLSYLEYHSRYVPAEVWTAARRSVLGGEVFVGDRHGARVTGQLMGDYLSFPLLCLTNFVGFVSSLGEEGWRISRSGLLLINGDDILFRASRVNAERWMQGVAAAGLVLSRGKTLVHGRVASINSQFFSISSRCDGKGGRRLHCQRVPVIRYKTWVKPGLGGLAGRLERIILDAASERNKILRAFFASVWGRVKNLGLPIAIARCLVSRKEWNVKEWKERARWYADHDGLLPDPVARDPETDDSLRQWVRLKNLLIGRSSGKWKVWQQDYAALKVIREWGKQGLDRVNPEDQGWGVVVPLPFRTKFKFDFHCLVGQSPPVHRYVPRAGIGAKIERLWEWGEDDVK